MEFGKDSSPCNGIRDESFLSVLSLWQGFQGSVFTVLPRWFLSEENMDSDDECHPDAALQQWENMIVQRIVHRVSTVLDGRDRSRSLGRRRGSMRECSVESEDPCRRRRQRRRFSEGCASPMIRENEKYERERKRDFGRGRTNRLRSTSSRSVSMRFSGRRRRSVDGGKGSTRSVSIDYRRRAQRERGGGRRNSCGSWGARGSRYDSRERCPADRVRDWSLGPGIVKGKVNMGSAPTRGDVEGERMGGDGLRKKKNPLIFCSKERKVWVEAIQSVEQDPYYVGEETPFSESHTAAQRCPNPSTIDRTIKSAGSSQWEQMDAESTKAPEWIRRQQKRDKTSLCSKAPAWVNVNRSEGAKSGSQFPLKSATRNEDLQTNRAGSRPAEYAQKGKLDQQNSASVPDASSNDDFRDFTGYPQWGGQGNKKGYEGWEEPSSSWGGDWDKGWHWSGPEWKGNWVDYGDNWGASITGFPKAAGSGVIELPDDESQDGGAPQSAEPKKKRKKTRVSLRDLGPPKFESKDRMNFLESLEREPERLKVRVAREVLNNPDFCSRRMNRYLFNKIGAKVGELNSLFGCQGISEMMDIVKKKYEFKKMQPGGEGESSVPVVAKQVEGGNAKEEGEMQQANMSHGTRDSGSQPERHKTAFESGNRCPRGESVKTNTVPEVQPPGKYMGGCASPQRKRSQQQQQSWLGGGVQGVLSEKDNSSGGLGGVPASAMGDRRVSSRVQNEAQEGGSKPTKKDPAQTCLVSSQGALAITRSRDRPRESRTTEMVSTLAAGGTKGSNGGDEKDKYSSPQLDSERERGSVDREGPSRMAGSGEIKGQGGARPVFGTEIKEKVREMEEDIERISRNKRSFGYAKQLEGNRWEVVILRHPTRLTKSEREFSSECKRANPPTLGRHNYCPLDAPLMLRCPIGGGSCQYGVINQRSPRPAILAHFNMHHRSRNVFSIKIEASRNGFIYMQYPQNAGEGDSEFENTFRTPQLDPATGQLLSAGGGGGGSGRSGKGRGWRRQPLVSRLLSPAGGRSETLEIFPHGRGGGGSLTAVDKPENGLTDRQNVSPAWYGDAKSSTETPDHSGMGEVGAVAATVPGLRAEQVSEMNDVPMLVQKLTTEVSPDQSVSEQQSAAGGYCQSLGEGGGAVIGEGKSVRCEEDGELGGERERFVSAPLDLERESV